jgi:hypothetical protein
MPPSRAETRKRPLTHSWAQPSCGTPKYQTRFPAASKKQSPSRRTAVAGHSAFSLSSAGDDFTSGAEDLGQPNPRTRSANLSWLTNLTKSRDIGWSLSAGDDWAGVRLRDGVGRLGIGLFRSSWRGSLVLASRLDLLTQFQQALIGGGEDGEAGLRQERVEVPDVQARVPAGIVPSDVSSPWLQASFMPSRGRGRNVSPTRQLVLTPPPPRKETVRICENPGAVASVRVRWLDLPCARQQQWESRSNS